MTLEEIKDKLGIETFQLYRVKNTIPWPEGYVPKEGEVQEEEETAWLRHWDNGTRVSVAIHEDLAKELASDKKGKISSLSLQHEVRNGAKGDYDSYRIIRYTTEAEMEL